MKATLDSAVGRSPELQPLQDAHQVVLDRIGPLGDPRMIPGDLVAADPFTQGRLRLMGWQEGPDGNWTKPGGDNTSPGAI
jgi:hypothetical protein